MSVTVDMHGDEPVADAGLGARLAAARGRAGLTLGEFYFRYVALGGSASPAALADHVSARGDLSRTEHDLAVLVLNERFLEIDSSERLPYMR